MGRRTQIIRIIVDGIEVDAKKCNRCRILKHLDCFSRSPKYAGGRLTYCKECRSKHHKKNKEKDNASNRVWYKANKDRVKEAKDTYYYCVREYRLGTCAIYRKNNKEKIKKQKQIYLANPRVKEQRKIKAAEYRRNNPEYIRRYNSVNREKLLEAGRRRYLRTKADNPTMLIAKRARRRAWEASLPNTLSTKELSMVWEDFDHRCALTGSTDNLEMDHFIPISWGAGGTYLGNVYPLTCSLNRSKGAHDPFKWAELTGVDPDRWRFLVSYLARQNNMTVDEFRDMVQSLV